MTKEHRGWPAYILNGRLRTSTAALIAAFLLIWWLYEVNQPEPTPAEQEPTTQVVPPGFVPDPNYTWVPRTDIRTRTPTPTPTPTTTTPTETTSPTSPTDTTTSGPPTTSPTTTTPAPPGAPASLPSPASPGPEPSPTPSR